MPSVFSVAGSPVNSNGVITVTFVSQPANTFLRGPASGADAAPSFGPLVSADLPDSGVGYGGTVGSSTQVPVITFDAKGRITGVSVATIPGGSGGFGSAQTEVPSGTRDGSNVVFTPSRTVGQVLWFAVNGLVQTPDYSTLNGDNTLTVAVAPGATDVPEVSYLY